jgi:hypothetical protein
VPRDCAFGPLTRNAVIAFQRARHLKDSGVAAAATWRALIIQAIGLGYSRPAGLMERPPLPRDRPVLTRGLIAWLAFTGLLTAIGTLVLHLQDDQLDG